MVDLIYDALIIGIGPAGASAARYVALAGYSVLMIGEKSGSLFKAEKISNYYGQNEISGEKLFKKGVKNATNAGAVVKYGEVFDIIIEDNAFSITSSVGKVLAKTVLIATGVVRNKPSIQNLNDYDGNGVSWCAVCDGFLYRKRHVGVLGDGAYALEEAEYLSGLGCNVTLFTDGKEDLKSKFETVNCKIDRLFGDNGLEGVLLSNGEKIELDCLFIALGSASSTDFARKIGLETSNGHLIVNGNMQTNCKGVFAAGDCVGGLLQVAKAVSDGAIAGVEMSKYLKGIKKDE